MAPPMRCVEVTVDSGGAGYGAVHHHMRRRASSWLSSLAPSQVLVAVWFGVAALFLMSAVTEDRNWRPNGVHISLSTAASQTTSASGKALVSVAAKQKLQKQQLGAMQQYDEMTGMLKTIFSEPGLLMKLYWSTPTNFADMSGDWPALRSKLGKPDATSYNPAINFRGYESLEEQVGPDVPEKNSSDWGEMLVVWRGRVEILKGGEYTFKVETSSPATVRLAGDLIAEEPVGGEVTKEGVKLESGYHKLVAMWKAPFPYKEPVFVVTYNGPDTEDQDIHLVGYHFDGGAGAANAGEKSGNGPMDGGGNQNAKVREGFGLLVYNVFPPYDVYPDTGTELPTVADTYNSSLMKLCCAGPTDTLDFRNHEEWVNTLEDEGFPKEHVVVQAIGIFRIEDSGTYTFSLTSDDGSMFEIDDDTIITNQGDGNGELLHPRESTGTLFLEKGWHSARVLFFANNTDNDYDAAGDWMLEVNEASGEHDGEGTHGNRTWGTQVLILKYAGPDTGGSDQYELLNGWHEKGILELGSIRGLGLFGGSFSTKYGERNPLWEFDKRWLSGHKDKPWKKYDKKDWNEEIGNPVINIIKPYTDWTKKADAYQHSEVPRSVYEHKPSYDRNIVDLGKSSVKWDHSDDADNGHAVIGKDYDGWDHTWFKTPNSVSPPSGRRRA